MSNCVVGSVGLRLPGSIIAEHSVEGSECESPCGQMNTFLTEVGVPQRNCSSMPTC